MLDVYHKIRELLNARERRNAVLLFGMMLIMGLLDAIGVASVMLFISVVVVLVLSGAYGLIYAVLRHCIARIGAERVKAI